MPTIGSITKTIRIKPNDLEIIEGLMRDGTSWSGAIHKLCESYGTPRVVEENPKEIAKGTPKMEDTGTPMEKSQYLKDFEGYCSFFGVSEEEFVAQICQEIEAGHIMYDGMFRYDIGLNLEWFREVCHEKGLDEQKALDKMTQMMAR